MFPVNLNALVIGDIQLAVQCSGTLGMGLGYLEAHIGGGVWIPIGMLLSYDVGGVPVPAVRILVQPSVFISMDTALQDDLRSPLPITVH
jgi:hypothetical protein